MMSENCSGAPLRSKGKSCSNLVLVTIALFALPQTRYPYMSSRQLQHVSSLLCVPCVLRELGKLTFLVALFRCLPSSSNNSVAAPPKPMAPPSSASCSTAVALPPPRPQPRTSSSLTLAPLRPPPTRRPAMPFASFMLPTPPSTSLSPAATPSARPKKSPLSQAPRLPQPPNQQQILSPPPYLLNPQATFSQHLTCIPVQPSRWFLTQPFRSIPLWGRNMLRPISAMSLPATSSSNVSSFPPPSSAGKGITLAPSSKFRTAATPAAPTASSPLSAGKAAACRLAKSFRKSSASRWDRHSRLSTPNPHRCLCLPAKSFSVASISAPTAAIFRPASNSKISSAASSTKPPLNASASAPSSPSTLPRTLSISLPRAIASLNTSTCLCSPPPTASSPPCTAGIAPSTTPAASNSSTNAFLTRPSARTSSP